MALHRIADLVLDLTTLKNQGEKAKENKDQISVTNSEITDRTHSPDSNSKLEVNPSINRKTWPISTPCAVIERASCPDQRVIRTTLEWVVEAIEEEGSRPPGLLVLGKACEVLHLPEMGRKWVVEEGFGGLGELEGMRGMEGMGVE